MNIFCYTLQFTNSHSHSIRGLFIYTTVKMSAKVSLEEVAEEVGVPVGRLSKKCSKEHLNKISLFLDWRATAPHLGLDQADIRAVDEGGKTAEEKRLKTLQKWRGKYGSKATYRMLVEVLLSIGQADYAEEVCQLLVSTSQDLPIEVEKEQWMNRTLEELDKVANRYTLKSYTLPLGKTTTTGSKDIAMDNAPSFLHPTASQTIDVVSHPQDKKNILLGTTVTLTVEATGKEPFRYSWEWNPKYETKNEIRAKHGIIASKTLRECFDKLTKQVKPQAVAPGLFAKGIIDSRARSDACNVHNNVEDRAQELLGELLRKVQARPKWFNEICDIFEKEHVAIVNDLRASFHKQVQEAEGWRPLCKESGEFYGAESATLTIHHARKDDQGYYRCLISNDFETEISKVAILTIAADPPSLTSHPQDEKEIIPGEPVTLTIKAQGTEPLAFFWERRLDEENWQLLSDGEQYQGVNTPSLTILSTQKPDEGSYRCIVQNDVGTVESQPATITVANPPTIAVHPLDTSGTLHGDVRFTAEATGSGLLEFCWEWKQTGSQDWQPLSNDTEKFQGVATTVLTVTSVKKSDEGMYRCVISNGAGLVVSNSAELTVVAGTPSRKRLPSIMQARAAEKAFRKCFDVLTENMDPQSVAAALYSDGVISIEALTKASSASGLENKTSEALMKEVMTVVSDAPHLFDTVCEILHSQSVPGVPSLRDVFQMQLKLEEMKKACSDGDADAMKLIVTESGQDLEVARKAMMLTVWMDEEKMDIFKVLLECDISPEFAEDGWTPLQVACVKGHSKIVRILLEKSVDISIQTEDGKSLLHLACENGRSSVVMELLFRDADIHATDMKQRTPLHVACEAARKAMTPLVPAATGPLARGRETFTLKKMSQTKQKQLLTVIENLLKQGARCDAQDQVGNTPLHVACWSGNTDVVKVLLEGDIQQSTVNLPNMIGETPLHIAAQCGFYTIVEELGSHGGSPLLRNMSGLMPSEVADQSGHPEVAKMMLSIQMPEKPFILRSYSMSEVMRSKIHSHDYYRNRSTSVISSAVRERAMEKAFQKCFAAMMTKDFDPQSVATALYSEGVISSETLSRASIQSAGTENRTTRALRLFDALSRKVAENPKLLDKVCQTLEMKSVSGVRDLKGEFQRLVKVEELKQACSDGNVHTVKTIATECGPNSEAVQEAVMLVAGMDEENIDVFGALMGCGCSPNFERNGWTPLQEACMKGNLKIVRILVQNGADESVQTQDGKSLLHLACENRSDGVVMELLSRNASIHSKDTKRRTPLHAASEAARNALAPVVPATSSLRRGHPKSKALPQMDQRAVLTIIANLTTWGAKCDAQDEVGNTPLHTACWSGNTEVVKKLLQCDKECKTVNLPNMIGETPLHIGSQCGFEEIVDALGKHGADPTLKNKVKLTPAEVASLRGYPHIAKTIHKFKKRSTFFF